MPSFQNTFGKEESDKNLSYDNTAFLHFSISLSVALIALLICMLVYRFISDKQSKRLRQVKSSPLFSKQVKIEKKLEWRRQLSGGIINKVLLIVALSIVAWLATQAVREQGTNLKGFDPYELLGVEFDTPIDKIRKAYRKLALELHPDRNPNNHEVSAKFILVSKAYECLTDEKVKANCQKFGNPDGQQSFKVGIALPSFLVQKQNHIVVMCWTFVVMLLIIPKLLLNWNFKLQAKDDRGVYIQNYQMMYQHLKTRLTQDSIESMIVSLKGAENLLDNHQQLGKTSSNKQVQNIETNSSAQESNVVLSDKAKKNLEILKQYQQGKLFEAELIQKIPDLLRQVIIFTLDFCTKSNKRRPLFINQEGKKVFAPFVGVFQYDSLIKYSQEFYQNTERTVHGLNQLSLPREKIEELKDTYTIFDLVQYSQARKSFFQDLKGGERLKCQISQEIDCLPCIDYRVTTFAGQHPERVFTHNDIATFKFKINRKALGNPNGIAYIPKFPYLKQEKYYISLEFYGVMVYFQEVTLIPGQTYEATYNYVHRGPPQTMKFTSLLCSDCYFGLDYEQDIELTFNEFTGSNAIEFHPTDKRLEFVPMNQIEGMLSFDTSGAAEDELLSDSEETAVGNEQTGHHQMHQHKSSCCDHNHEEQNDRHEEEQVHNQELLHQPQLQQQQPEGYWVEDRELQEQSY